MKGKVLGFDAASGAGAITGDDGQRYTFAAADFKSPPPAKPNDAVDFEVSAGAAKNIYVTKTAGAGVDLSGMAANPTMANILAKPNVIWAAIVVLGGLLWATSPYNQLMGAVGSVGGGGISSILNMLVWAAPIIAGVLIFFELTNNAMTAMLRPIASYVCIGAPILLPILAGLLAGPYAAGLYGLHIDIGTILMVGGGVLILLTNMGILPKKLG